MHNVRAHSRVAGWGGGFILEEFNFEVAIGPAGGLGYNRARASYRCAFLVPIPRV